MRVSIMQHREFTYIYLNGREYCYRADWFRALCRALVQYWTAHLKYRITKQGVSK